MCIRRAALADDRLRGCDGEEDGVRVVLAFQLERLLVGGTRDGHVAIPDRFLQALECGSGERPVLLGGDVVELVDGALAQIREARGKSSIQRSQGVALVPGPQSAERLGAYLGRF